MNEWMEGWMDKMILTSYYSDMHNCGDSFSEEKTLA